MKVEDLKVTIEVEGTWELGPKEVLPDAKNPTEEEIIESLRRLDEEYVGVTDFLSDWSLTPIVTISVNGKPIKVWD